MTLTLALIRMASLVGPPLLGGGLVVTAMLAPAALDPGVEPPPAITASAEESANVDAAPDTPSLFNRAEGSPSASFAELLGQQDAPPIESAPRPALSPAIQARVAGAASSTSSSTSDRGHVGQQKSVSGTPTNRVLLGSSQEISRTASGTDSGSTTVAAASSASQFNLAARASAAGSQGGSSVASKPAASGSSSFSGSASSSSSTSATPPLQQFQFFGSLQASPAVSGRSAATPSR